MNKPADIVLVTGGQRSGKSELAEKMALDNSPCPVYIATCRPMDAEMERRVALHKVRREGWGWSTVELLSLAEALPMPGDTILIDSATMLASNAFFAAGEDEMKALEQVCSDFDAFVESSPGARIIVVSDEIGLGGIAANAMMRRFADLQGLFNRHLAEASREVYLTVAGIPIKIK